MYSNFVNVPKKFEQNKMCYINTQLIMKALSQECFARLPVAQSFFKGGVPAKPIKKQEDTQTKIERLKWCSLQEGEAVLEGIAALQEFDKAVLRKVIDQINVYGEGRSKVVWKSEDMFGVEKNQQEEQWKACADACDFAGFGV